MALRASASLQQQVSSRLTVAGARYANGRTISTWEGADMERKPGMYQTYKNAAVGAAILLASLAVMVGLICGAIAFAGAHPRLTATIIFGSGLVGLSYLLARAYWIEGGFSRFWGASIFLLALAVALVQLIGCGQ